MPKPTSSIIPPPTSTYFEPYFNPNTIVADKKEGTEKKSTPSVSVKETTPEVSSEKYSSSIIPPPTSTYFQDFYPKENFYTSDEGLMTPYTEMEKVSPGITDRIKSHRASTEEIEEIQRSWGQKSIGARTGIRAVVGGVKLLQTLGKVFAATYMKGAQEISDIVKKEERLVLEESESRVPLEYEDLEVDHITLPPEQETEFQKWYADWAVKAQINPDPDDPLHKYDYRKAFQAGAEPEVGSDNKYHWPSEFKDPDHPNLYIKDPDNPNLEINTKTGERFQSVSFRGSSDEEITELKELHGTEDPELKELQRVEKYIDDTLFKSPELQEWKKLVDYNDISNPGNLFVRQLWDGMEATGDNSAQLGIVTVSAVTRAMPLVPYFTISATESRGMIESAIDLGIPDSMEMREDAQLAGHVAGVVEYLQLMLQIRMFHKGAKLVGAGKGTKGLEKSTLKALANSPLWKKVALPLATGYGISSIEEFIQGGIQLAFLKIQINKNFFLTNNREIEFSSSVFDEDGNLDWEASLKQLLNEARIGGAQFLVVGPISGGVGFAHRSYIKHSKDKLAREEEYIRQIQEQALNDPIIEEDGQVASPKGKLDEVKLRNWLEEVNLQQKPENRRSMLELDTHMRTLGLFVESAGYTSLNDFIAKHITIDKKINVKNPPLKGSETLNSKGQLLLEDIESITKILEGADVDTSLNEFGRLFARHINTENAEVVGAWVQFYNEHSTKARSQIAERLGIPSIVTFHWKANDIIDALLKYQKSPAVLNKKETQMVKVAQELFASHFMAYVSDPKHKAPTKRLRNLFEKYHILMRKLYLNEKYKGTEKQKIDTTKIPLVVRPKIHPSLIEVFDSALVAETERFSGVIVQQLQDAEKEIESGDPGIIKTFKDLFHILYPVKKVDGVAVIEVKEIETGETVNIEVTNLIKGEELTEEQKEYLEQDNKSTDRVLWNSPLNQNKNLLYEEVQLRDMEDLSHENISYDVNFLSKMNRKELDTWAKRIGIANSKSYITKLHLIQHIIDFHRGTMAARKNSVDEWDAFLFENTIYALPVIGPIARGGRAIYTHWAKGYNLKIKRSGVEGKETPFSVELSNTFSKAIDSAKRNKGLLNEFLTKITILGRNIPKAPTKIRHTKSKDKKKPFGIPLKWIHPVFRWKLTTAEVQKQWDQETVITIAGPDGPVNYTVSVSQALMEPETYSDVVGEDYQSSPELEDLAAEVRGFLALTGFLMERAGWRLTRRVAVTHKDEQGNKVTEFVSEKVSFKAHRKPASKKVSTKDLTMENYLEHLDGRFPRAYTEEFWLVMLDTNDAGRKALAVAFSDLNSTKYTFEQAKKELDTFHNNLVDVTKHRSLSMEFMRVFERVPVSVTIPRRGRFSPAKKLKVYETSPYNMVRSESDRVSDMLGFIEFFGQDPNHHRKLAEEYRKNGHDELDFWRMIRVLQGTPMFTYPTMGTTTGREFSLAFWRYANALLGTWKVGKLTNVVAVNLPETYGSATYVGVERYKKALIKYVGGAAKLDLDSLNDIRRNLIAIGAVSEDFIELSIRKGESLSKTTEEWASKINNITLKGTGVTGITRINEVICALSAQYLVEDAHAYRNGDETKFSTRDFLRLQQIGLSEIDINILLGKQKLFTEKETQIEIRRVANAIVTRMPAFTQGTNKRPGEKSQWANHPLWKFVYTFDSFAMNRTARTFEQIHEISNVARKGNPDSPEVKSNKVKAFLEFVRGTATAGAAALFIRNLWVDPFSIGHTILSWFDEDEDKELLLRNTDWFILLRDIALMSWGSGPAGSWLSGFERNQRESNEFSQTVIDIGSSPSMINDLAEVLDALWGGPEDIRGRSRYKKEKNNLEVIGKFLQGQYTISKPILNILTIMGFGDPNKELAWAMKHHWKAVKKLKGSPIAEGTNWRTLRTGTVLEQTEESAKFYTSMAEVGKLMNKNVPFISEESVKAMQNALVDAQLTGLNVNSVISSLKSRRTIANLPKDLKDPNDVRLLESYLNLLPLKAIETLGLQDKYIDNLTAQWNEVLKREREVSDVAPGEDRRYGEDRFKQVTFGN